MAASRFDMFWAEAIDVNAATESPTKSARISLFVYFMTELHHVDFLATDRLSDNHRPGTRL